MREPEGGAVVSARLRDNSKFALSGASPHLFGDARLQLALPSVPRSQFLVSLPCSRVVCFPRGL